MQLTSKQLRNVAISGVIGAGVFKAVAWYVMPNNYEEEFQGAVGGEDNEDDDIHGNQDFDDSDECETGTAVEFDQEVDVLVTGYGIAGATTAIQAADDFEAQQSMSASADSRTSTNSTGTATADTSKNRKTNKILIVDRFDGGGATTRSGGIIYLGGGTDTQKKLGIYDTPENMFAYLRKEVGDSVSAETLYRFCKTSPGTASWLRDSCKVKINMADDSSALCPFKTSNPPEKYTLFYSGSETAKPFSDAATEAPRGHKIAGPPFILGTGYALFANIDEEIRSSARVQQGIRVRPLTRLVNLIWNQSKTRVVGAKLATMRDAPYPVKVFLMLLALLGGALNPWFFRIDPPLARLTSWIERKFSKEYNVRAKRGVVLSAGGFCKNQELVQHYQPDIFGSMPIGSIADDGFGIFEVGVKQAKAATKFLNKSTTWKFIAPPAAFPKGISVNVKGERLVNEDVYGARLADYVLKQGGKGWLILDQKLWDDAYHEIFNGEMLPYQQGFTMLNLYWNRQKANTLKDLARSCGMDPIVLEATVERFNRYADQGLDEDFGKQPKLLYRLHQGPFYAVRLDTSDTSFITPTLTLGGLQVDETSGLVVSSETGEPINGLYAAGRNAAGICSTSYVSGLSLADCVYAGRRAGRHLSSSATFGAEEVPLGQNDVITEDVNRNARL